MGCGWRGWGELSRGPAGQPWKAVWWQSGTTPLPQVVREVRSGEGPGEEQPPRAPQSHILNCSNHKYAPSFCLPGLFPDLPTGNTLNGGSVFAPDTLHLGLGGPWQTPRHQCADGAGQHSCRLLQCACGTHLNEASVQDPPSQAGPAPCPLLHASRSPVTERPQSHHESGLVRDAAASASTSWSRCSRIKRHCLPPAKPTRCI